MNSSPLINRGIRPRFSGLLGPCLLLCLSGCDSGNLELAGVVERRALELASPISEVITESPVAEGERVDKGQIVVQLDTQVVAAELRAQEAAHAAASAQLTEAQGAYERQERLRRSKVATEQALDNARRQRDEALSLVAEKEARIVQAKKRLEDLTVRTRAAGVVDQLPFEQGERVPAGGVVAVVITDEAPFVRVWLPARAVAQTGEGTRAEVRIEGLDQPLEGRITYITRESAFTPHFALTEKESAHLVFESRITLDDAPADLRPGIPAQVRIKLPN